MIRSSAVAVAALHLSVAVTGAFFIAPAVRTSVAERAAIVAARGDAWSWPWLVPIAAGLSLVWFVAVLCDRLRRRGGAHPGIALAPLLTTTGAAIETAGSCLAAGALPALARDGSLAAFQAVEAVVALATSVAGNTFFSLGQLLLVRALAEAGASRAVVRSGHATVAAGAAFAIAGAAGPPSSVPVATGALLVTVSPFAILVARSPVSAAEE